MSSRSRSARTVAPLIATLLLAIVSVACGDPGSSGAPLPGAVRVVTTTTILADLVAQVGGERVTVDSLVPKGGEVHTFDPTPSDVRRLADADLVFLNGLGLDDWLASLVTDAGTSAPVVRLGEDLAGVDYIAGGVDGQGVNPHLWLNAAYAARYAERIAEQLRTVDPTHAADYDAGLAAYAKVLDGLDTRLRATLGKIPEANRTVISFHDAFPYFAAAYGLRIDGTIVDAPGQDPSAGDIANLIRVVKADHVRAIFAEAQFSEDLVRTIADETGAAVVSDLYTDTVGDPPVDTYVSVMDWNLDQVVQALGG
jgi:ABC-type Zn uptake system ZnuABC Zn-binding protein ZnuA